MEKIFEENEVTSYLHSFGSSVRPWSGKDEQIAKIFWDWHYKACKNTEKKLSQRKENKKKRLRIVWALVNGLRIWAGVQASAWEYVVVVALRSFFFFSFRGLVSPEEEKGEKEEGLFFQRAFQTGLLQGDAREKKKSGM